MGTHTSEARAPYCRTLSASAVKVKDCFKAMTTNARRLSVVALARPGGKKLLKWFQNTSQSGWAKACTDPFSTAAWKAYMYISSPASTKPGGASTSRSQTGIWSAYAKDTHRGVG